MNLEGEVSLLEREPELLGRIERVGSTEDPVVADHSLEARVVAVEPVDHVATVRSTESGSAVRIDLMQVSPAVFAGSERLTSG